MRRYLLVAMAALAMMSWSGVAVWAQPPRGGGPDGFEQGRPFPGGPEGRRGGPEGRRRGGPGGPPPLSPERAEAMFERADQNGDGMLDKSEFMEMVQQMQRRGPRGPRGEGGQEGERRRGRGGPNPEAMLKKLDQDESGTLSADEVPGRMKQHFEKVDTSGDGEVDLSELQAFHEQMRQRRESKGDRDGQGRRGKGKGGRKGKKPQRPAPESEEDAGF